MLFAVAGIALLLSAGALVAGNSNASPPLGEAGVNYKGDILGAGQIKGPDLSAPSASDAPVAPTDARPSQVSQIIPRGFPYAFSASEAVETLLKKPSYDYKVTGSTVYTAEGSEAYSGGSMTEALNWALGHPGSTTYVPAGSYQLYGNVNFATGSTLYGDGDSTVFNFASRGSMLAENTDHVTMRSFLVTGSGNIQLSATSGTHGGHLIQDVTAYRVNQAHPGAFMTYVAGWGSSVDGVKFIRDKALESSTYGFLINGDFTGQWTKNIYFEECVAAWNGVNGTTNEWAVGFDLAEGTNVNGMTLVNCTANDNLESGFHFEDEPLHLNVRFQNCVANNNGAHKYNPLYGAGFFMGIQSRLGNVQGLETCSGTGNAIDFLRYDPY